MRHDVDPLAVAAVAGMTGDDRAVNGGQPADLDGGAAVGLLDQALAA